MRDSDDCETLGRRKHERLPVTIAALIRFAGEGYAGRILDVSEGGFLVAPTAEFEPVIGASIEVETAQLGIVPTQVVAVSAQGLHLRVSCNSETHRHDIKRLAKLIRPWVGRPCA